MLLEDQLMDMEPGVVTLELTELTVDGMDTILDTMELDILDMEDMDLTELTVDGTDTDLDTGDLDTEDTGDLTS